MSLVSVNDESLLSGVSAAKSAENADLRTKIFDLESKLEEERLKSKNHCILSLHFVRTSREKEEELTLELAKLKNEKAEILNANAELSNKIRKRSADIDELTSQNSNLSGKYINPLRLAEIKFHERKMNP